jgi:orotidine-5'-phosphate decarboxylase
LGLVLALDKPAEPGLVETLCAEGVIGGVKIGLPAVLRGGLEWARSVARACRGLRVVDFKLADIGPVMVETVRPLLGDFNVFIAHAFVGASGALADLKSALSSAGARLALVASMSHPGSSEVYDRAFEWIVEVIRRVEPWGLVAPATRPHLVSRLRGLFPSKTLLSPGVGAQGAEPGVALCAGADYEIVGRAITASSDPLGSARSIAASQRSMLRRCRGDGSEGG